MKAKSNVCESCGHERVVTDTKTETWCLESGDGGRWLCQTCYRENLEARHAVALEESRRIEREITVPRLVSEAVSTLRRYSPNLLNEEKA